MAMTQLKKRFNLLLMLFAIVATAGLTSCDDDTDMPYYGYRNLGVWNLYSINDVWVHDNDTYDLEFFDDGTGVRTWSSGSAWSFVWDIYDTPDGEELQMVFPDGATYNYFITIGFDDAGKYMELYDLNTGNVLLFYAY